MRLSVVLEGGYTGYSIMHETLENIYSFVNCHRKGKLESSACVWLWILLSILARICSQHFHEFFEHFLLLYVLKISNYIMKIWKIYILVYCHREGKSESSACVWLWILLSILARICPHIEQESSCDETLDCG